MQNGGTTGIAGAGSLGAGIGALMQTLGNLNQAAPRNQGPQQGSVFNRLGTPQAAQGKPAGFQGSPAAKKNESPQKDAPAAGNGVEESPAAAPPAKTDDQGFKTPQSSPWQQRNQGSRGGRWGPSPNQNQENSGGRNQGGGGGNWQQRNNQNNENQESPAAGGDQQGNWQGGQRGQRGRGGRWGQNRGDDKDASPQQQNDNETPPRGGGRGRGGGRNESPQNETPRGGRQGGRGGGGGRNESPQNRNYGGNRGGRGGGGYGGGRGGFRGGYDRISEKVMQMSGPQIELPPMEFTEKKFNANSRLFVGNLPRDLTEEELKEMFSKYGELGPFYFNKEGSYAFINFDFRCNAEKAKRELASHVLKGRTMKVRVASVTTGVRVKNMSPMVSNELLNLAFSAFGEVEASRVMVNERGKSTGEGTVIFADKKGWSSALRKCEEECFFLTTETRPAVVEPMDASNEEEEGLPEISMPKNQGYHQERQQGPRFADHNSFEYDYGQRYKRLFEIYKERKAALDRDFAVELDQLEAKMAIAKHDFDTDQLRRELERREADMDRLRRRAGYAGVDTYGSPGGMGDSYSSPGGMEGGRSSMGGGRGGMGDNYGGGYGGMGGAQQSPQQQQGGGGYGRPGQQQSGNYGGSGQQQGGGAGYGGANDSQYRGAGNQAPPAAAAAGGYEGSQAMQVKKVVPEKKNENEKGEDYQRGLKRPASIGELEQDKPSEGSAGAEGPEFKRRF